MQYPQLAGQRAYRLRIRVQDLLSQQVIRLDNLQTIRQECRRANHLTLRVDSHPIIQALYPQVSLLVIHQIGHPVGHLFCRVVSQPIALRFFRLVDHLQGQQDSPQIARAVDLLDNLLIILLSFHRVDRLLNLRDDRQTIPLVVRPVSLQSDHLQRHPVGHRKDLQGNPLIARQCGHLAGQQLGQQVSRRIIQALGHQGSQRIVRLQCLLANHQTVRALCPLSYQLLDRPVSQQIAHQWRLPVDHRKHPQDSPLIVLLQSLLANRQSAQAAFLLGFQLPDHQISQQNALQANQPEDHLDIRVVDQVLNPP